MGTRIEFDTALIAINCADRHRMPFIDTVLPDAALRGMGVIGMKVYAQGALLGRTRLSADEALGYALTLPGLSTAILGCRAPEEVDENARIAREFASFDEPAMQDLERRTVRDAAVLTAYKKSGRVSSADR